jgi:diguanylate cyclase (GGDEF)-like protein
MHHDVIDNSPLGWGRIWIATILGTLLCVATVAWFNALQGADGNALPAALIAAPALFLLAIAVRRVLVARRLRAIAASSDDLTGLLTRQAFVTAADAYLVALRASGRPTEGTLLVIDVDNLKAINDAFDHETGDEVLRMIAETIRATIRNTDLAGRISGEEFAILLPGTTPATSELVAERIRRAVSEARFAPEDAPVPLSVTIGGASFHEGAGFADLVRVADRQLYAAKQNGRNRVSVSPVEPVIPRIAA